MKTPMLSACAAAMALTLSAPAVAQPSVDPLLQAHIAVTWNAPVQGLAKVLAERLALPYFDGSGSAVAMVVLDQGESSTVAQAMESINAQIAPAHLAMRLSQGAQGQRLELSKTQPDSAVVGVATGSVQAAVEPSPAQTLSQLPLAQAETPPAALQQWEVSPSDATLRNSLRKWTEKAGWQLLWEAGSDVPIPVKATFDGDFRTAVLALFDTLSASEVALNGLMYRGNKVLRVVEAGYRAE